MAWWVYTGRVTTPIDGGISAVIDEKGKKPRIIRRDPSGPTVLVPRLKFEAAMSSVAHLKRLKMVAPLKPHQIPKEPKEKTEVLVQKEAPVLPKTVATGEPKREEKKKKVSDIKKLVVASNAIKEKPNILEDDKLKDKNEDIDIGKSKEKAQQVKKEKGGKETKKRRG